MRADRASLPGGGLLLFLLFLLNLFHFVDRSLLVIAIEPLRAEFALDDFSLSLLTGAAYSLPFAVAIIPLGLLADRCDRARLLTVIFVLFSLATGVIGLAGSLAALVIARMAVGASEAGVVPASVSLLSDSFAPADRSRAFGSFFLASALGTVLSFGLGGPAMEQFGWRAPFLLVGATGLVVALVLFKLLRDPRPAARAGPGHKALTAEFGALLRRPRLLALWLGGAFATALMVGYWAWAASFFQREFGLSVGEAGILLAAGAGVMAGLGTCAAGIGHSRLRRLYPDYAQSLPAVLSVLGALAVFATATSQHLAPATAAFLIASFFLPMFLPIVFALGSEAVGPEVSASHAAVQQFANSALGAAFGPALVGGISAATGSLRTGLMCLVCAGIAAGLCFLGAGLPRRQSAA